jgi:alkylation response protein AidB-like acyl-CoA dehydrogenase
MSDRNVDMSGYRARHFEWRAEGRVGVVTLNGEVRALRIYEGATEVQKLIIARELLKE